MRIEKGGTVVRSGLKVFAAILIALAQAVTGIDQGHATSAALSKLEPFRPTSLVNEEPAVCDPFLKAWIKAFDGNGKLDEDAVDLAAIYPEAQFFQMPEFGKFEGGYAPEKTYALRLDFDGDGDMEVLAFGTQSVGMHYLGVELRLFDTEADFDRAKQPGSNPAARALFVYRPIERAHILKLGAKVYTLEGPHTFEGPNGQVANTAADVVVSLVELNAPEQARTVCTVRLYPDAKSFAEVIETMPLFVAARDVYGAGKKGCSTLGVGPPFDFTVPRILYRPWTLKASEPEDAAARWQTDAMRELRYFIWGLRDPQSWRDYLEVKGSRAPFLADMAHYYRSSGVARSKAAAKTMAEHAWRFVAYTLIYGHGPDGARFDLTPPRDYVILPITSDTAPEGIARLATAAWLTTRTQDFKGHRGIWGMTWNEMLLAAIYTRQPLETVRTITESVEHDFQARLAGIPDSNAGSRASEVEQQNAYWSQTLLAALGHNGLTDHFLDRANPNLGNDFDKTALMYAAQHNRLNAIRLLLAGGVKVDAITDAKKSRYGCVQLDRDHRTALMYAAENASPAVIDALLDAGSSVAALDTKGNDLLWYFSRNIKVTNTAERARLTKRLGG